MTITVPVSTGIETSQVEPVSTASRLTNVPKTWTTVISWLTVLILTVPTTVPAHLASKETVSESTMVVQMLTSVLMLECEPCFWLLVTPTHPAITPTVAMNVPVMTVIRNRN